MARKDKNIEYIKLPSRTQWMVTFSDMITLLMTFFVLLISMSSMDAKAMKEMLGFFNEVMGPLEFAEEQEVQGLPTVVETVPPKVFFDTANLSRSILNNLESKGIGGFEGRGKDPFEVRQNERGLAISISSDILFDEGSHELKEESLPILQSIAQSVYNTDSIISVEGHTDDRGTAREQFRLSLRRAGSVLDYFIYSEGMSPKRFTLGGYGATRPLDSNASAAGPERNRRVEIVLLKHQL
ncbi:MAG: flagellar motor protein MotB [Desulfomonilia bacterium]